MEENILSENAPGCTSVLYDSFNIPYSKVCGQIQGYGFGSINGLYRAGEFQSEYVNASYVDGINILVMQVIFGHFLQDSVVVVRTSQTLLVMIGLVKSVGVLLVGYCVPTFCGIHVPTLVEGGLLF